MVARRTVAKFELIEGGGKLEHKKMVRKINPLAISNFSALRLDSPYKKRVLRGFCVLFTASISVADSSLKRPANRENIASRRDVTRDRVG